MHCILDDAFFVDFVVADIFCVLHAVSSAL